MDRTQRAGRQCAPFLLGASQLKMSLECLSASFLGIDKAEANISPHAGSSLRYVQGPGRFQGAGPKQRKDISLSQVCISWRYR